MSAYHSQALHVSRGPCRVFRVDTKTGRQTGFFDIPSPCGHAGGIAYPRQGTVYVADRKNLFEIHLGDVFAPGVLYVCCSRVTGFPLEAGLTGALAASGPDQIWLGTYNPDGPGRIFRFDGKTLRAMKDGETLERDKADKEFPIPDHAQGAAVDPDGKHLWIARSDVTWATLDKLEIESGEIKSRIPAPAGLEGISFAGDHLWAISEAGARHIYDYPFAGLFLPFNPLIFELDISRLRPE